MTAAGPQERTDAASRRTGHPRIRASFPGDANRGFVLALSASGFSPGYTLRDGRVIPLTPDPLTFLTLSQNLSPLLVGNISALDRNGEAAVTFDLNPLGISRISEPLLFVL